MRVLSEWDSFYVIIASAAGGLIGLQFIVITLIGARPPAAQFAEANAAYTTPTTVHFGTVLFLGAILRAPWETIAGPSVICALAGLGGAAYSLVVARRMRGQGAYVPQREDWLFHVGVPLVAHLTLAASAIAALSRAREALFGFGAAALLLLLAGIHNAWDAVSFHVQASARRE